MLTLFWLADQQFVVLNRNSLFSLYDLSTLELVPSVSRSSKSAVVVPYAPLKTGL